MNKETRRTAWIGIFIALSFIGSYIKIPSPLQSIALDSAPAFLAGLILGGVEGGLTAFIAHILTAANAGFPLSFPIHLLVGIIMILTILLFHTVNKRINMIAAGFVGILVNGLGAPLILSVLPSFGWGFFVGIVPFLLLASTVNVAIAMMIFLSLKKSGLHQLRGFDSYDK